MGPGQICHVNLEARAELPWWDWLLDNWAGTSVHQFLLFRHPDHHLYTDASGTWDCSAWSPPHWLQIQWSAETSLLYCTQRAIPNCHRDSSVGHFWTGKLILCHCDNAAVVTQVNKLHGRDLKTGHMLKCLVFLQAVYDCRIKGIHAAGVNNPLADATKTEVCLVTAIFDYLGYQQ